MNSLGKKGLPFLFIIDFDMEKPLLFSPAEIDPAQVLFDINGFSNVIQPVPIPLHFGFEKKAVSFESYLKSFDFVMSNIQKGNSYLLNLTFPSLLQTELSLAGIFHASKAKYKLWYKDEFTVFSPEIFIRIREGRISSFPMKGTIDADIIGAEALILQDEKELAEHYTIVDLIRNDLAMVSKEVRVNRFRYVEKLFTNQKNLLQVSSEISGKLPADYRERIGDIIFSLLPAGSVSGAPKKKTIEIIHEAEICERGYYTGVFGYFDGNHLDSAVMIRFIEKKDGQLYFKSGGGITFGSKPLSEYNEMIDKVYVPIN